MQILKMSRFVSLLLFFIMFFIVSSVGLVSATSHIPPGCPGGPSGPPAPGTVCPGDPETTDPESESATDEQDAQAVYDLLRDIINVLSMAVGIVVVGSIIFGGIQYTTSGGDPKKVAAAKHRMFNALLALIAYFFIYSFLQWLIPGGIF